MPKSDPARIALAERHVRKGRAIVAKQRALVECGKAARRSVERDENLLTLFEQTQAIFERDLERLEDERDF